MEVMFERFLNGDELCPERNTCAAPTFRCVALELLSIFSTKSKKTYQEFETITRLHLNPYMGEKPIKDVGMFWEAYVAHQKKKNPRRKVFHDRKVLKRILYYAKERRLIDFIPKMKLDPADKAVRERLIVDKKNIEQVRAKCPPMWRDILLILAETGMRFGEVRQMRKEYIDFSKGLIRLPAEIIKTRRPRTYLISKAALKCLKNRVKTARGEFLFPKRGNTAEPIGASHRSFQRALKAAGINFQLHDLRSTYITRQVRRGMPVDILGKLVGASEATIRDVYLKVRTEDWFQKVGR